MSAYWFVVAFARALVRSTMQSWRGAEEIRVRLARGDLEEELNGEGSAVAAMLASLDGASAGEGLH